jgi:hypothetical protein
MLIGRLLRICLAKIKRIPFLTFIDKVVGVDFAVTMFKFRQNELAKWLLGS